MTNLEAQRSPKAMSEKNLQRGQMMNELKPCPFCGKTPTLEIIPPHTHSGWLKEQLPDLPDYEGSAFIECGCSAAMAGDNADDVIKKWNKRTNDE